jgi:L-ascorbate metabolism protein UlaG (beta-lactamase superfamily)
MNITHIRNATQLITYAGKRLLIDPMLAPKGLIRVFRHGACRTP